MCRHSAVPKQNLQSTDNGLYFDQIWWVGHTVMGDMCRFRSKLTWKIFDTETHA